MTPADHIPRRRALHLLAGADPSSLLPGAAWADDDDAEDDRVDGSRRGRGRGGDEDEVGRDGEGPGRGDGTPGEDGHAGRLTDSGRLQDVAVLYPDGWTERVRDGRYELIDHLDRLVVTRPATAGDVARILAAR